MLDERPGVIVLPRARRLLLAVLLVEADEHVDELAANRRRAEQVGQLGQADEPVGVPRCPVVVGAVDDPVDAVVRLPRFVQQLADPRRSVGHRVLRPSAPAQP